MSISNEVVKFIAEIELDAQDKAAFTKALKDANDECATFRKEIALTETEMAKLAAAGARQSNNRCSANILFITEYRPLKASFQAIDLDLALYENSYLNEL